MEYHRCEGKQHCQDHKKIRDFAWAYRCNCCALIKKNCPFHIELNRFAVKCATCHSGVFNLIDDIEEYFRNKYKITDIKMLDKMRAIYSGLDIDDYLIEDKVYGLGISDKINKALPTEFMAEVLGAKEEC